MEYHHPISYRTLLAGGYTRRIMACARSIILLLCLCALALRAGGVHVHVAVDHDDAPHQAHFADLDLHYAAHDNSHAALSDDHHKHVEVSLDSQALSKKPGSDLGIDALLLVATLFCLLLAPRKPILPLSQLLVPPMLRFAYLRPPQRGPPLHA